MKIRGVIATQNLALRKIYKEEWQQRVKVFMALPSTQKEKEKKKEEKKKEDVDFVPLPTVSQILIIPCTVLLPSSTESRQVPKHVGVVFVPLKIIPWDQIFYPLLNSFEIRLTKQLKALDMEKLNELREDLCYALCLQSSAWRIYKELILDIS